MVSKLSDNGVAGFILANGALSGSGEEYKIRKKLIENKLVEAILILPRNLFYTTDISVTLWILNKNKKSQTRKIADETRKYREREKKYTQFSDDDIQKVVSTYHQWQVEVIENVPEFCYAATLKEVEQKDFSLVPSKYIEFINRDESFDFDEKMSLLKEEFTDLLKAENKSKNDLLTVFKELGYEIKL
jgi:type I restriction enzyme M protein